MSDEERFCCGYCGSPNPQYHPFTIHLDEGQQYGFEGPYGDWIWVEEEEEEGYLCLNCGAHLFSDECYWGEPYKMWSDGEDGE